MSQGPAEFEALARSLMAIADPGVRVSYVRHHLLALAPEVAAELFERAMTGLHSARSAGGELLQCLSLAFADESCDPMRESVRGVLISRDLPALARALTRVGTQEDPQTQRIPDFGKGRHVSLGERKSLARGHNRELIARSLRDPHPGVMRILLGNPILTETDVVRLCAQRPASSEVLREVFRNGRWIVRHAIKVALALNPYTPLDIGLQLIPFLQVQDLRRLVASEELDDTLRACARERAALRGAPARP